MDNDGKVTDLVEQSKSVFLSDAVQDFRRRQAQYDLGSEFAKTRKNRTALVPGVIVSMVLVFSIVAFAINFTIERSTEIAGIETAGFDQVNLRDVLQAWLRTEQRIQEIDQEIGQLTLERDERIDLVRSRFERERRLARLRADAGLVVLGPELLRINQAMETELQEIRLAYTGRLEALATEREDILSRREREFDAAQVEIALERREILDDQRRLFDPELQRQQEFLTERVDTLRSAYRDELSAFGAHRDQVELTLRQQFTDEIARIVSEHESEIEALIALYNPDFSDENVARLLDEALFEAPDETDDVFGQALAGRGLVSDAEIRAIQTGVFELNEIVERLREIPYENSVPDALDQILSRSQSLVVTLNRLGGELAESFEGALRTASAERDAAGRELAETEQQLRDVRARLSQVESAAEARIARETEELRSQLDQFEYAFGGLIQDDREDGYIVDPRDPDRIHVYLDPSRDVTAGIRGFVFREPEGLVGEVEFFETSIGFRARLLSLADNRTIRPFDRVLLDIARGAE